MTVVTLPLLRKPFSASQKLPCLPSLKSLNTSKPPIKPSTRLAVYPNNRLQEPQSELGTCLSRKEPTLNYSLASRGVVTTTLSTTRRYSGPGCTLTTQASELENKALLRLCQTKTMKCRCRWDVESTTPAHSAWSRARIAESVKTLL